MTIHQMRKACFVLDPDPLDGGEDGQPHHATWHEADEELRTLREECGPDPRDLAGIERVHVKDLGVPCWVAECDKPGCEEDYGDDDSGATHFPDAAALMECMGADGWTAREPDKAYCWGHGEEGIPPSPSPAEQEAAGQLVLPGVQA